MQYLIIGASSGIGYTLAQQLSAKGNRVYGTYNQHPITEQTDLLSYHPLNVLDAEQDLSFLPEVLDGVVYCVGAIQLRPFERIKAEDFLNDYRLQVLGAIQILQKVMPLLKKSESASIVLVSTLAVQTGLTFHSQVASSKGAIEGLVRALAAEYAPKIRVNAIAPSLTDTPLAASLLNTEQKREANALRHPLKRIGTSEDMSEAIQFLLGTQSAWVTGQILAIDGGMSSLR